MKASLALAALLALAAAACTTTEQRVGGGGRRRRRCDRRARRGRGGGRRRRRDGTCGDAHRPAGDAMSVALNSIPLRKRGLQPAIPAGFFMRFA